jgi:hypothetical protein
MDWLPFIFMDSFAAGMLRTFLVVFAAPGSDKGAGMRQTGQPAPVEAFVAPRPAERFDAGVPVRLARLDQPQLQRACDDTSVAASAGTGIQYEASPKPCRRHSSLIL